MIRVLLGNQALGRIRGLRAALMRGIAWQDTHEPSSAVCCTAGPRRKQCSNGQPGDPRPPTLSHVAHLGVADMLLL